MKKSIIYKVLLIVDMTIVFSLIASAITEIAIFPKENPELLALVASSVSCLTICSSILIMLIGKKIKSSTKKSN